MASRAGHHKANGAIAGAASQDNDVRTGLAAPGGFFLASRGTNANPTET
jgi:hypothetical protein